MADFEVGDTVKVVITNEGEVLERDGLRLRIKGRGWFDTDNDETVVEVVEKRKPKVGDEMTEALFLSLPNGALVQRNDTSYLFVAVCDRWMGVKNGVAYLAADFRPLNYTIVYIPE